VLVAAGAEKTTDVVIADADEVGEVGAELVGDHVVPCVRVVAVIEVALMQHEIGPFRRDEPQDRAGAFAEALVGDKRYGHGLRRCQAVGLGRRKLRERHAGGGHDSAKPGEKRPNARLYHPRCSNRGPSP
jgi:hypothetical protein